ncbi:MAG: type IV pilus assembly protein PilM [Planctomycetes bacterium]|nr:type IV pilus assembly protein PilM [Planctomycetota bacterium]
MAAGTETVWAIDIGNSSLKALHLSTERGAAEVIGFDKIRHGKILSGSGVTEAEKEELVALSLRRFVNKHDLSMDEVAVSVSSQNSFARFVNLPPVEAKRVPEIVKFEAVQQIPFDINDVQWDWQLMTEDDSAELKVGIFAIKNDVVNAALEHYDREDIQVSYVQMAPMALYNYVLYDRPDLVSSDSRATVVLNVGAEITDLVVCTKSAVWQRCILIGGNTFTRAIADTFRLNFEKAEKLKRTAPVSKYARQIFQAMRPVFSDLASEVQRSLGFFKSSNPKTKVVRVIGMGGGTKLRGLLKYLQQTLQMPVERPDSFKRLAIGPSVPAAKFGENICEFAVVYGLALQGLGLGGIESNLLPRSVARSMAWAGKGRWFIGAACLLLAVSVMALGRTFFDSLSHTRKSQARQASNAVLADARQTSQGVTDALAQVSEYELAIDKEFEPFKYREIIPSLHETILSTLPNTRNNPMQARLYAAFEGGDVEGVLAVPRKQRKQLFITNMSAYFTKDLSAARFGGRDMWQMSRGSFGTGGLYDDDDEGPRGADDYRLMEEMRRPGADYGMYDPMGMGATQEAVEEKKPGFVVTIAGYSPYESIEMLIDPPGAERRPERWGFVTRLLHLDDFVADGNSPFELYGKTDPNHFKLEVGEVDLQEGMMPTGIGEQSVRYTPVRGTSPGWNEQANLILVDPMTKELISKTPVLDENGNPTLIRAKPVYQVNDHWFVLNIKFVWRDAPKPPDTGGLGDSGLPAQSMQGYPVRPASPVPRPTGPGQLTPEEDW